MLLTEPTVLLQQILLILLNEGFLIVILSFLCDLNFVFWKYLSFDLTEELIFAKIDFIPSNYLFLVSKLCHYSSNFWKNSLLRTLRAAHVEILHWGLQISSARAPIQLSSTLQVFVIGQLQIHLYNAQGVQKYTYLPSLVL